MTSLKYFCEDTPDYHIIAAGNLLGIEVNRSEFSFPVGKVDMKTLYLMDMYYWESEWGAEVDFVIQREGKLIPVEVKSADNTKAKSLKVYMEAYKPDYAIKLSAKNFGFEDGKKTVPLYAAFCI